MKEERRARRIVVAVQQNEILVPCVLFVSARRQSHQEGRMKEKEIMPEKRTAHGSGAGRRRYHLLRAQRELE